MALPGTSLEAIYREIGPRRRSRAQLRELGVFFAFISPWLFGFFVVTVVPLLWGFYLSLTNFTGLNFEFIKFIGRSEERRVG